MKHQEKSSHIRKEINQSYHELKETYPILKNQDYIGFTIFFITVVSIIAVSIGWYKSFVPTWLMIVLNAFFMGILHEIEHDLIHWLYFKRQKWVHHGMLLSVWILRPLTVNPWIRRKLHYHHHKFSGTLHDVEERSVTNGEKWSVKRLLTTPDVVLGGLLRLRQMFKDMDQEVKNGNLKEETSSTLKRITFLSIIPVTIFAHVILYLFFADQLLNWINTRFGSDLSFPYEIRNILNSLHVVIYTILLPNLLRQFCLHFITSNMHYFGDVEEGNVMEQTQVLTVWWTFPMQVFCFFFGWTHSIHHFVVNETFYVRHIGRRKAHEVLRKYGVRFNDLGTFRRANRFREYSK
ncbi:fatty acid desaturase [Chryseobacterium lactis]|uniref:Fatty acid desaturase n=1 Tax=Chryseobacterium lactis TaxID=1241981 RepID=A0A3G6RDA4_CHRLC|nr:fatty acid desaturase [Chryseobacterium lactis]AZA82689.1 fatty acid desaturase [Chryseobacterium lactis]AZB03071.1 fatty acid desaturase [Chryseobacterium lactis]PNW11789.1 fatty acid desaturase [Chryseobacterium lactis]